MNKQNLYLLTYIQNKCIIITDQKQIMIIHFVNICVHVFLPVRSFSRNWIKGKTMLSAIWLASSEWREFSWTRQKQIIHKYQALHKDTNKRCTLAKHLEGFLFILIYTMTFAARYSSSKLEISEMGA